MKSELHQWMEEVTAILCYSPDIPMQYKADLADAFERWKKTQPKVAIDDQNVADQAANCQP